MKILGVPFRSKWEIGTDIHPLGLLHWNGDDESEHNSVRRVSEDSAFLKKVDGAIIMTSIKIGWRKKVWGCSRGSQ